MCRKIFVLKVCQGCPMCYPNQTKNQKSGNKRYIRSFSDQKSNSSQPEIDWSLSQNQWNKVGFQRNQPWLNEKSLNKAKQTNKQKRKIMENLRKCAPNRTAKWRKIEKEKTSERNSGSAKKKRRLNALLSKWFKTDYDGSPRPLLTDSLMLKCHVDAYPPPGHSLATSTCDNFLICSLHCQHFITDSFNGEWTVILLIFFNIHEDRYFKQKQKQKKKKLEEEIVASEHHTKFGIFQCLYWIWVEFYRLF